MALHLFLFFPLFLSFDLSILCPDITYLHLFLFDFDHKPTLFDQDTCWDEEDGSTPKLNLHLLTTNRRELSPSAWLQFDSKNQVSVSEKLIFFTSVDCGPK
jgi:hypothetical protein